MDLFEKRSFIDKEIEERAKHLFKIAKDVDVELSDGEFEAIPYISACNGVGYKLNDWEDVKHCHEWDETRNQWISKTHKRVNLHVSEHSDPYEDYLTTSWSIEIPYDLSLGGDDDSIKEYFKVELGKQHQNQRNRTVTQLYFDALKVDKNVLLKLLDSGLTSDSSYQEKYDFLIECGVVREIKND